MESSTDLTCGVLGTAAGDPESLQRFVVGRDRRPTPLDQAAIADLGDPFATLLLAKGVFPRTPAQLLDALDDAIGGNDKDPLAPQQTFVVGEGSQLELGAPLRGIRSFLITRGRGGEGPDMIVSTRGPDAEFIEVMAWDRTVQGFNYYQTRADSPWVLAGNSADALVSGSAGSGPFESHPSGSPLMKELRFPWVHWSSSAAKIQDDIAGPELASHPWFARKSGAQVLEKAMMAAITRWTSARLAAAVAADGTVADPGGILRSFLDTPTVNLVSSKVQTSNAFGGREDSFDIPQAFFVDSECLKGILGLPSPDPAQLTVSSAAYRQVLTDHGVALRADGTTIAGPPEDTNFLFVVPERAFEDVATVAGAIEMGLVSSRLAACLLMVDFANPVFSDRRKALLGRVPTTATIVDKQSSFSEDFANAILNAPAASEEGSPEHEFKQLWEVGDDWPTRFKELLNAYYAAFAPVLRTPDGLERAFQLAESRRNGVRAMPINEHPLLFATPDPPLTKTMRMQPNGQIVEG